MVIFKCGYDITPAIKADHTHTYNYITHMQDMIAYCVTDMLTHITNAYISARTKHMHGL